MIEEITLVKIKEALGGITAAKNINLDDNLVSFVYKDKDGDDVTAFITIENDEQISCIIPMPIPKDYFVTSILCSNLYNSRKDTHGTFSYAISNDDDNQFLVIEGQLSTRGGITDQAVKHYLRNFIHHINGFETIMIPAIRKIGPDSSFLKSGLWDTLWQAVGTALGAAAAVQLGSGSEE